MACPLNDLNEQTPTIIIDKLQRMINNNIAIVFIIILLMGFLGVSLYYFASSLFKTLKDYYINKGVNKPSPKSTNNLKDKNADNEVYEEPSNPNDADVEIEAKDTHVKLDVDIQQFMPKYKKDFLKSLEVENKQYNEDKTTLLTKRLNYPENDDKVDAKIFYKEHDDYRYDYYTE